jgi:hypothetical protein
MNNEDEQQSNLVQIGSVIPKKYHDSILDCPTVPSSGIPQVNMSGGIIIHFLINLHT